MKGELNDFMWSCKCCKVIFPFLENTFASIKRIETSTELKITGIQKQITDIELNTEKHIKDNVATSKDNVFASIKTSVEKIVDARFKEMEDRKRRENNLVLLNVPDKRSKTGQENKLHDIDLFEDNCTNLGLDSPQIITIFRLGKKI